MAASGCFGYGVEYADAVDLASLGAVVSKGLFLKPREGHPPERIVETPAGMLNAIGLQGIGVHRYIKEKLPELRAARRHQHRQHLRQHARRVRRAGAHPVRRRGRARARAEHLLPEHQGRRHHLRVQPARHVRRRVSAVKKVTHLPVIPKLTPNVTDVASIAKAAEDAGADAVSLVNTFLAMAIDVETRRPKLSNIVGGLSGPAIRPIAVRMVYECRRAVKIPIIGMGGIATATDALEFIIAGATAVQVGTANFVDPFIWTQAARRPARLHAAAPDRARRRPGRHRSTPARGRSNGSAPSRARRRHAARARWQLRRRSCDGLVGGVKIGSRLFTLEGPGARPAQLADTRHARVPRSQVPRHSQHRGAGGGGRHARPAPG